MLKRRSRPVSTVAATVAGLLATVPWAGGGAHAETPLASISISPDVTVLVGPTPAPDEGVVVDNLLGMVMPVNLGPLPQQGDVSGYELLSGGDRLLCFDRIGQLTARGLSPHKIRSLVGCSQSRGDSRLD
jgi:hypothetical protein